MADLFLSRLVGPAVGRRVPVFGLGPGPVRAKNKIQPLSGVTVLRLPVRSASLLTFKT